MGGVVFVTTFIPTNVSATDLCDAGGTGYLYVFDYQCAAFSTRLQPDNGHLTDRRVIRDATQR